MLRFVRRLLQKEANDLYARKISRKMPRKCSVPNCCSNYETSIDKTTIYRFPTKDENQLKSWLAALPKPNKIKKVTRNMDICSLHWPPNANFQTNHGKRVPSEPPSVFLNDNSSSCQQPHHRKELLNAS